MSTSTFTSVAGLNRALRRLPKAISVELRDASQAIANDVASRTRSKGLGIGRGWQHLAPTVRSRRDRVPVVVMGGSKRLPGRRGKNQTVGDLMWGTEFGGGKRPTTQQFLPHLGTIGYALWPTVRSMEDAGLITGRYADALGDALEKVR